MRKKNRNATPEYLTEESEINVENYTYFVGIDPSYSSTGLVVLRDDSDEPLVAISIKAGAPHEFFYKRLKKLLDKLDEVVLSYPIDDIYVVMEGAAFASEYAAFKLGKLSGVIEYHLGTLGIDYSLVAPTYVKKVATGSGAADKKKVMEGVKQRWGFTHICNDITDAYAMAQIAKGAKPISKKVPKKSRERAKR